MTIPPRIPLADLKPLVAATRRTRRLGLAAAGLVVVLSAAAVAVASAPRAERNVFLPHGTNGIVVLDVSASISSDTYARIVDTLSRLAGSDGRYGLILVSDTAYEALPPGTPAAELRRFERFFRVPARSGGEIPQPPRSPWSDAFSAGTRLSTGLQLALDVVRRDRLARPAVLLVSDLDDDISDLEPLTSAAISLRREGATLRAVSLNAAPEDGQFMSRLLEKPVDLAPARLPGEAGYAGAEQPVPRLLAAITILVGLALAALLGLTERLRWRAA